MDEREPNFQWRRRISGPSRPAAPLYVIRTMDGEEIQLYQQVLLVELKFLDVCCRPGQAASPRFGHRKDAICRDLSP